MSNSQLIPIGAVFSEHSLSSTDKYFRFLSSASLNRNHRAFLPSFREGYFNWTGCARSETSAVQIAKGYIRCRMLPHRTNIQSSKNVKHPFFTVAICTTPWQTLEIPFAITPLVSSPVFALAHGCCHCNFWSRRRFCSHLFSMFCKFF